jgi:hypothetical protein
MTLIPQGKYVPTKKYMWKNGVLHQYRAATSKPEHLKIT